MSASMMSWNERFTSILLVGDDERMPRRGRSLTPRQSAWCYLGFHRWIALSRYQRRNGVLYEVTYNRCERLGCERYPVWTRMDVSRVKR